MKRLKQSSALLLVVSFLLSIFSFSAFAVEETKVTFHPRVLNEKKTPIPADGKFVVDPPGIAANNLKYKLYRIDDSFVDDGLVDYGQGKFVGNENEMKSHSNVKIYEVNVNNYGEGSVTIKEDDYGWYYVELDDQSGDATCAPFVISVRSTDMHLYPKVVLTEHEVSSKKHKIKVEKFINGVALKDSANQSNRVNSGNYVMKFKIQKYNENLGSWVDCFDGEVFETISKLNANNNGNGEYGTKEVEDLANGKYRIVEKEFVVSGGNKGENAFNTLDKNMFKKPDQLDEEFYFEFELNEEDDDKDVKINNVMLPQISKFIMDNNKRYLTFGVKPGEYINYKLEVEKPYIKNQDEMSEDDFGKNVNGLSEFEVTDDAMVLSDLVLSIGNNGDNLINFVDVKFVDKDGVETILTKDMDYEISGSVKGLTVKFINKGMMSYHLAGLLYKSRGNNKAHFEIEFKVRTKDQVLFNDYLKNLRQPDGEYTNLVDLMGKMSIVNFAKVKTSGSEFTSNKVRSQFGILRVNKFAIDQNGDRVPLDGAVFGLRDENGNSLNDGVTSDDKGHADFVVPIGKNIEFDGDYDYLYHSGIIGEDALALVDTKIADNFGVDGLKCNNQVKKYQVKELIAPYGFEVIGKAFNVTMDAFIKDLDVRNYPITELPFTGGMGTILFTVVGILLIGSGAYLLINSKRKKSF